MNNSPIQSKLNAIKKKKTVIKNIENSLIKARSDLEQLEFSHWKLNVAKEKKEEEKEEKEALDMNT